MAKRGKKNSKKVYNNRLLYSLIALGVLIIAAVGVYATAGASSVIPNPGHPISELQTCNQSGDILQMGSDGNWSCVSLGSSGGTSGAPAGAGLYGEGVGYGVYGNATGSSGIGGYFTSTNGYALITGTGNVGIGISDPAEKLNIGNVSSRVGLLISSNTNAGNPGIKISTGANNDYSWTIYNWNADHKLYFSYNNNDLVTMDTTGGVYATAYYYSSDRNLKTNIQPLQNSLQKIEQLNGVSFNWKSNGLADDGLIAQDVQKVYPELVSNGGANGTLAVNYAGLIAPLIEAVKTQQQEINDLQQQVNELKAGK